MMEFRKSSDPSDWRKRKQGCWVGGKGWTTGFKLASKKKKKSVKVIGGWV